MDARHLRDEAVKVQTTAQSLRADVMKTRDTAKGHEDNGGDASADYRQADDLEAKAEELEQQADAALAQATANEARALEIEREQKRLEADMKQHIGELEKEKHRLRGSSGLFG